MKNILLTLLLLSPLAFAEEKAINLICKGEATVPSNQVSSSTANIYGNGGSASGTATNIISRDNQVYSEIIFKLDDGYNSGSIQLPSVMRPPIGGKNIDTWELNNISVTDTEIKAKFRINFLNKPKVSISRVTGRMEYKAGAWPKNFSGDCEKLDITKKKF